MRLDKFLAEVGVGTRTEVKKIIKKKQILVNGETALKPEMKINENSDVIEYNGNIIKYQKYYYYLLNKPAGCVTALKDNMFKTVMDCLDSDIRKIKGFAPVGRLDKDTEGLLLLTNDGQLTHHLLSPAHHVSKKYYAKLDKKVENDSIELFEKGIDIGDDKPTLPSKLEILEDGYSAYLTITEGRFHQVKRMFKAVGCEVIYLKRVQMGKVTLDGLDIGEYRELTPEEIDMLSQNMKKRN
ncbi:16S rRNA pseudouridine516 synthase [Lachnospiraceae bacterium C7]|nr:16S rRNA pseudouridine516 synthase [Lachnospiraceae bacterium C7]